MKRLIALLCAAGVVACSHVDTGQIDYRVADSATVPTNRSLQKQPCHSDIKQDCDFLLPARVVRRYQPNNDQSARPIKAKEVYSIEIGQGMVGDKLLEGIIFGKEFGLAAEFAVLANVFEFASNETDVAKLRFLESGEYDGAGDDPSDVELKLVYFSEDTETNQPFNFSKVPLKPRTIYNGGSIGIQIVIMEVDVQAGPVTKLLTTLARFGQKSLPGPGEAKDMLFDLGESLFAGGSKDDRIFEYRFVLSSGEADPQAIQGNFVPGRYVLRRMQDRKSPMEWGKLRLDHNTARLFRWNATSSVTEEVRDELYLVLNVQRFPENTAPEYYAQQDWSDFQKVIQDAADARAAPLDTVRANLEEMLVDKRSERWKSRLASKWSAAESRLAQYTRKELGDPAAMSLDGTCNATAESVARERDLAKREAEDAVRDFIGEYRVAAKATYKPAGGGGTDMPEFSDGDRTVLASLVARYFMPWSDGQEAMFATAQSFENVFTVPGASGDLTSEAVATAKQRHKPAQTCRELVERGLAAPA